jgi:hypothetical protein
MPGTFVPDRTEARQNGPESIGALFPYYAHSKRHLPLQRPSLARSGPPPPQDEKSEVSSPRQPKPPEGIVQFDSLRLTT